MNKQPIAILGAGIGGLTAAIAMLKRGIDVDVYEQAVELRELGAGVQIASNGTRLLNDLLPEGQLESLAFEPEGKQIRLWDSGQTWKLFDLGPLSRQLYGAPYLTMHRNDLHQLLLAELKRMKPGALHLGYRCVSLTTTPEGYVVRFADGTEITPPAAVGADGVHSVVRASLFGDSRPEFTGLVAWRGVIPMHRVEAMSGHLIGTNWIGPGRHIVHYPLRSGTLMNFVGIVERDDWKVESWTEKGSTDELAADFEGWHPDIHRMIRSIEQPFKWALMGRKPMQKWSVGCATLLGDACHPTLPFMAQGAAMAIEDGYMLARSIEKYGSDYAAAFVHYEDARRDRTARVVIGSNENAKRFHDPRLAKADTANRYVNEEWAEDKVKSRYDWLFTYDAMEEAV